MGAEAVRIISRIVERGCPTCGVCQIRMWRHSDIKPSKQFTPSHPISSCPPPFPCAPPTTSMSTNLYEILGVQRDATDDQSTFNPHPWLVLPLNTHVRLQSEKHIKKGPYKPTRIVFPKNRKQQQGMSSERSPLSMHSLCYHHSFLTNSRSIMHTKCLSIPISVGYVIAFLGILGHNIPSFPTLPLGSHRHTMLLGSGHHHLQGREGRVIVVAPAIPAGSAMCPSPKSPSTLAGTTTLASPILSDSSSLFSASCIMPCLTHSSLGVEIATMMYTTNVGAASLMTITAWASRSTAGSMTR